MVDIGPRLFDIHYVERLFSFEYYAKIDNIVFVKVFEKDNNMVDLVAHNTSLTLEQKTRALQIWNKYVNEGEHFKNASQEYTSIQLDKRRNEVIPEVKIILQAYLSNQVSLEEFKTKIDSINKRNRLWGFKGINGQMFFNMLTKTCSVNDKLSDFEKLIKSCLVLPTSVEQAVKQLEEFAEFTKSLSKFVADQRTAPNLGSINFFLSYFWQIQDPINYPVYYTSMTTVLQEYNLWSPSEKISESYLSFYRLNHELRVVIGQAAKRSISLWDVEHAFWFMTQPSPSSYPVPPVPEPPKKGASAALSELPDSYIPPVIGILQKLAVNDPILAQLCQNMGTSIEVVFEKRIDVLFKMLGYETEALGHGHGRVPDGVAICREFHYAIGYDAKVRQQSYNMGTDERAIREYILKLSDRLRREGINKIYFFIISSSFAGDHDDVIRSIKMETDVREILLVEVEALVALVDTKLRDPLLTLGSDGIQRLFANSGILSEADVKEFSGI